MHTYIQSSNTKIFKSEKNNANIFVHCGIFFHYLLLQLKRIANRKINSQFLLIVWNRYQTGNEHISYKSWINEYNTKAIFQNGNECTWKASTIESHKKRAKYLDRNEYFFMAAMINGSLSCGIWLKTLFSALHSNYRLKVE